MGTLTTGYPWLPHCHSRHLNRAPELKESTVTPYLVMCFILFTTCEEPLASLICSNITYLPPPTEDSLRTRLAELEWYPALGKELNNQQVTD